MSPTQIMTLFLMALELCHRGRRRSYRVFNLQSLSRISEVVSEWRSARDGDSVMLARPC
jgi:hypothetical protein